MPYHWRMAISLATATTNLAAWTAASEALATGQSYSIGERSLSRENGQEVRAMIGYWTSIVNELTSVASGAKTGRYTVATFV